MLKIFRNLQLISKDEFDLALYQCTNIEDSSVPKQKHLKLIIDCLKGSDSKILPLDAFNKFYDVLTSVSLNKWVIALKIGYVLYQCLEQDCSIFIKAVCCNHLFDKIKNKPQKKSSDPINQLHINISQNLYNYLQLRYENYEFFQNALQDFDQNEDFQKTFIASRMVQLIQNLVKLNKELDISLQKFTQIEVLKYITVQLLNDLFFFYPKIQIFLQSRIQFILDMKKEHGLKMYQVYVDTLRLSRNVTLMTKLCLEVNQIKQYPQLNLFQIEQNFNRQVELHFKDMKKPLSPLKQEIIRFDDDSLNDHSKEEQQIGTPPKLLQQFQKLVTQQSFFLGQEDDNVYQIPQQIQTERQQQNQYKLKKKQIETNEQSMLQSAVSTNDNCSSVRNVPFSHQSSFRYDLITSQESHLNFIDFSQQSKFRSSKK